MVEKKISSISSLGIFSTLLITVMAMGLFWFLASIIISQPNLIVLIVLTSLFGTLVFSKVLIEFAG